MVNYYINIKMIILRQKAFIQAEQPEIPKTKAAPMSKVLSRRGARVVGYKTKKALENAAWGLELNPQETVKQGIKGGTVLAAEHPLVFIGKTTGIPLSTGIGYMVAGPEGATAMAMSPIGFGSGLAAMDPVVQKTWPAYHRVTKKAGDAVRNSKGYDSVLDAIVGRDPQVTLKNSGPNATFLERAGYNAKSGIADISRGLQGIGKAIWKTAKHFSEEERDFSYKGASRLVRGRSRLKAIGNSIMTPIYNAGLNVGDKIKEIYTGRPIPKHMKIKFVPKTQEQLTNETISEIRKGAGKVSDAMNFGRTVVLNPEEASGKIAAGVAKGLTSSPVSTAANVAYFYVPGSTTASRLAAPVEKKIWDGVNNVGVGNYTIGRVTKPVKQAINKGAEGIGRGGYNYFNMLVNG